MNHLERIFSTLLKCKHFLYLHVQKSKPKKVLCLPMYVIRQTNQIVEGNDKSKSILYTSHSSSTNFQKPLAHNYVSRQSQCIHCREAKCIPPSYNSIPFLPFPYNYYALYSSHRLTLFELNIKKSKRDRNTKKRKKDKFS